LFKQIGEAGQFFAVQSGDETIIHRIRPAINHGIAKAIGGLSAHAEMICFSRQDPNPSPVKSLARVSASACL
jgi:hypothetical protein